MPHPLLLKGVSRKRILALLTQHGTTVAAARVLGVCSCTLRDQMRRLGIPGRPLGRFHALSDDALLRLMAECGNSLRALRRRLHVDWSDLVAELDARDLHVKPAPLLAEIDDATLVRALTENGLHLKDAARTLGVSRRVLVGVMVARGLLVSCGVGVYPLLKTPGGLVRCLRHVAPLREHKLRRLTTQALRDVMAKNTMRGAARLLRVAHGTLGNELARRGIPWNHRPGPQRRSA